MNSKLPFFVIALCLFANEYLSAQSVRLHNVLRAFESISNNKPSVHHFKYNEKAHVGGHLQGIQVLTRNNQQHIIITASSALYSYYLIALPDSNAVLHKISDAPFRHAGGCQLADEKLFTGVEDNLEKDKAKVMMISPLEATVQTIAERRGAYKRATAGAVGAVKVSGQFLVAVGDWDSRHIDFYISSANSFDSVATYNVPDTANWCSYQSINLVTDTANRIFMLGFCRQGSYNRVDLYRIDGYRLSIISTRYFTCSKGCSFRYGAGISIINENEMAVYTCSRKLKKQNSVNVFEKL